MDRGFILKEKSGVKYFVIDAFEKTNLVKHCFTTKVGGVSKGYYSGLNLGLHKEDNREDVIENYKIICGILGIEYKHLVASDQVHDNKIYKADKKDLGKGIVRESDIIGIDGLITDVKGVPLITYYADCVPLFFLDPVKKSIGTSHAGWKGSVLKIGQETVFRMKKEFGTKPEDLLVGIGPSIGPCCYEVDEPVISRVIEAFPFLWKKLVIDRGNGKWDLNLWETNALQLEEIGVRRENIFVSGICTSCSKELLFSHRRDKGKTGSLAAIIQLI